MLEAQVVLPQDDARETASGTVETGDAELVAGAGDLVGLRFPLHLDPGARILSARLQLSAASASLQSASIRIEAQASVDAPPFQELVGNLSFRQRGEEDVLWLTEDWVHAGARGPRQQSPDLASILQEVVDRAGWSSGNALVLLLSAEDGQRVLRSADQPGASGAQLTIEYD